MDWLRTSLGDSPLEGQVDDSARRVDRCQRVQRGAQDSHLPGRIARLAEGATAGILDRRHARHAQRCRQVGNRRQDNRRKAGRLDLALHQSHGPAADRSGRRQQHDVDAVLPEMADDGWRRLVYQLLRLQDIAHDGVVTRRRLANDDRLRQLVMYLKWLKLERGRSSW